ncbi:MAG: hypothetical protein [Malazfec virus 7]
MIRHRMLHEWVSWKSAHYNSGLNYFENLHQFLSYFHFSIIK